MRCLLTAHDTQEGGPVPPQRPSLRQKSRSPQLFCKRLIIYSEQFAYLDRMFVVALIFVFYASISYAIFDRLSRWLLQWTPQAGRVVAHG